MVPAMLCTTLIGRTDELASLQRAVEDARHGRGGLVVVRGDAGVGKSRIVDNATSIASSWQMTSLAGRCVPSPVAVPHRPLVEAFVAQFRSIEPPSTNELDGFRRHLAPFVPAWSNNNTGLPDPSPILVGEAILRLLRSVAGTFGCILTLEDVHWADAETLGVMEYLADAARSSNVLCICTTRWTGAADELIGRLHRRGAMSLIDLDALSDDDVDAMVEGCLGTTAVPPELLAFVRDHSDGLPFLVEELLAGVASSGSLRFEDGRWAAASPLAPSVPSSLRDSIVARLAGFDATARRVVAAASLLGRRFDWGLLPGITQLDGAAVVLALRAAVDAQLIEVDGPGFRFRHALTRDVVLGDVLPPERRELACRAWPAVEHAHPDLPGALCELAAQLAESAGEPVAAAQRLLTCARRALAASALTSAEAIVERARRLAVGDREAELDADELLVNVFVAEGKVAAALALGDDVADRMESLGSATSRRVDLLVTTTRAAVSAGRHSEATHHAHAARELALALDGTEGQAFLARVDAVAAHAALASAELHTAVACARRAVEAAGETSQPEVECEALEVLGRVARNDRPDEATAWFERSARLAESNALPRWHLRAQQELALLAWSAGRYEPMHATRALAERYGALTTVAVMDLSLADIALADFDRDGCTQAARACVDASVRYGLATESVAHLWLAGACALQGDTVGMDRAASDALARDPDDPRILGDLFGRVHTTHAFVTDQLDGLPMLLDRMMEHVRHAPPTTSIFPGRIMWAAVHAIEDDDLGIEQRAEIAEVAERLQIPLFSLAVEAIEALALGRMGDPGATTAVSSALRRMSEVGMAAGIVNCHRVLFARAAHRDGWGAPEQWLREAEAFFARGGFDLAARRCRTTLADIGARVPRRGRGDSIVPLALRAAGVTSREMDVLTCITEGMSNRDTADRLAMSPRTVERHVATLFDRLGVRSRHALADVGRHHLSQGG